jgi:DUF1009 family protein
MDTHPAPAAGPDAEGAGPPVAIICGGGTLPFAVADAVARRGRTPVLFAIKNYADPSRVAGYTHHWVGLGQAGRFRRLLEETGCRDVVFIGQLIRPRLRDLLLDWETIRLLPRIAASLRGGDDHLLSAIARMFEDRGFRLVGAQEIAPEILVPKGVLGRIVPQDRDRADIARGLELLRAIGPFDVGQAAVVANNHVLAVEGIEGTDLLLERVAELRRLGRIRTPTGMGVIVKAPKLGQDVRFDLPSIGPRTIEGAAAAGLAGVAVSARAAIIAEPERMIALANELKVFVAGIGENGTVE